MLNQHNKSEMLTSTVLKAMAGTVGKIIGATRPHDVADVVNDAVVKVLANIDTFNADKGAFGAWACRIAANTAINMCKLARNRGHDSEGYADEDGDAPQLVDTLEGADGRHEATRTEEAQWLVMALAELADDERTFIMAINDGMGQTEAGALVGWSPATATMRRRKIAAKMKALR